eukprot:m.88954 g.88954  ORF g.88954 m.88954 type:complete len:349 (+) comp14959_c3_seq1:331-1377(+)
MMDEAHALSAVASHEPKHIELTSELPHERTQKYIETKYGPIHVTIQGDLSKPALVTYHDVGLEHRSCFHSFFSYPSASKLATLMCVIHIDAPGQELDAKPLPDDYVYPTLDQLAEQVEDVAEHFKLRRFVGMGAGIGGNVLLRYGLAHPQRLYGLVLCGTYPNRPGWVEWGYIKAALYQLHYSGVISPFVQNTLLGYYYSPATLENAVDLVEAHRNRWASRSNARNLGLFLASAQARTDLTASVESHFIPSTLLIAGHHSPQIDEIEEMNGRLNPTRNSYVKVWGTANHVQEEQPDTVVQAVLLFIQGLGLPARTVVNLSAETTKMGIEGSASTTTTPLYSEPVFATQ